MFELESFARALESSRETLLTEVRGLTKWSSQHDELILALFEDEVIHEGQVICHMYGMGRQLPESWRWA
ncbi:MAG: hypothetical protein EA417_12675 [Gammaproteobacteria bacterium]|nr:MAG: hypothetical protein EA417_12675 [Gammaproteobacteria bacterium]